MNRRRLPPGQRWIDRLVVYDISRVEPADPAAFRISVGGRVGRPASLSLADVAAWPRTAIVRDVHCVTRWSVRDVAWEGVAAREVVRRVEPMADVRWVLVHGRDGYATNVPYEAFLRPDTLLADRMNGSPLPLEHGAPVRLVVPSLYAWKSAKYVDAIEFLPDLVRGFWEQRGYHDRGDPWGEERFRLPEQSR